MHDAVSLVANDAGNDPFMENCTLSPWPGRDLLLSEGWPADEESVLFDRNSGDFWVIGNLARAVAAEVLTPHSTSDARSAGPDDREAERAVLATACEELVASRILAACKTRPT